MSGSRWADSHVSIRLIMPHPPERGSLSPNEVQLLDAGCSLSFHWAERQDEWYKELFLCSRGMGREAYRPNDRVVPFRVGALEPASCREFDYVCSDCYKAFPTYDGLKRHWMNTGHWGRSRPHDGRLVPHLAGDKWLSVFSPFDGTPP